MPSTSEDGEETTAVAASTGGTADTPGGEGTDAEVAEAGGKEDGGKPGSEEGETLAPPEIGWTPSFRSLAQIGGDEDGARWSVPPPQAEVGPAGDLGEACAPSPLVVVQDELERARVEVAAGPPPLPALAGPRTGAGAEMVPLARMDACLQGDEAAGIAAAAVAAFGAGSGGTASCAGGSLSVASAESVASEPDELKAAERQRQPQVAHERAAAAPARTASLGSAAAAGASVREGMQRELAELRRVVDCEAAERKNAEAIVVRLTERLEDSEARCMGLVRDLEHAKRRGAELQQRLEEEQASRGELLEELRRHEDLNRSLEENLQRTGAARQRLEAEVQEEHQARLSMELLAKELQSKVEQFKQEMVVSTTGRRPQSPAEELPPGIEEQLDQLRQQLEATVCAVKLQREAAASHEGADVALHVCTDAAPEEELAHTEVQLMGEWVSVPSVPAPALRCGGQSATSLESAGSGGAQPAERGPRRTPVKSSSRAGSQRSSRGAALEPATPPAVATVSLVPTVCAVAVETTTTARQELPPSVSTTPVRGRGHAEDLVCSPGSEVGCVVGSGAPLSMRDLCEIKALKKPPPPIRMLMEVCCLLFGIEPIKHLDERTAKGWRIDYWEPARRSLLSDPFFLSKLRTYDEELQPAQRAKIRKYFQDPEFTGERVRKCSKAAYELYVWVCNVLAQHADSSSPRASAAGPPVATAAAAGRPGALL